MMTPTCGSAWRTCCATCCPLTRPWSSASTITTSGRISADARHRPVAGGDDVEHLDLRLGLPAATGHGTRPAARPPPPRAGSVRLPSLTPRSEPADRASQHDDAPLAPVVERIQIVGPERRVDRQLRLVRRGRSVHVGDGYQSRKPAGSRDIVPSALDHVRQRGVLHAESLGGLAAHETGCAGRRADPPASRSQSTRVGGRGPGSRAGPSVSTMSLPSGWSSRGGVERAHRSLRAVEVREDARRGRKPESCRDGGRSARPRGELDATVVARRRSIAPIGRDACARRGPAAPASRRCRLPLLRPATQQVRTADPIRSRGR